MLVALHERFTSSIEQRGIEWMTLKTMYNSVAIPSRKQQFDYYVVGGEVQGSKVCGGPRLSQEMGPEIVT